MTGSPSSVERAYQHLKTELLTGTFGSAALDLRALSDRLRMSVTPVREALARLCAERLVSLAPHQGYLVTIPNSRRLEHLYELGGALLDLCLERVAAFHRTPPARADVRPGDTYAQDMAGLTEAIARAQTNEELIEQISGLNDRLFAARCCEPSLFGDTEEEVRRLRHLWIRRDYATLRARFREHHYARLLHAGELADLMRQRPVRI